MVKLIQNINYFYLFRTIVKIFLYLISDTKRYSNLLFFIILHRPKSILEIGVYDGRRALQMIEAARIFNKRIKYYGFDLFEDFNKYPDILEKELSKKPKSQLIIKNKLQKKANVELYKGFTKKTLKNFTKNNSKKIDFIFIDGGHSIKTIKNDWTYIKKLIHKKSITIFDDYYLNNKRLIKFYGCNKIIDNLENVFQFKKLLFTDNFFNMNKKLFIKMVKVSFLKNN